MAIKKEPNIGGYTITVRDGVSTRVRTQGIRPVPVKTAPKQTPRAEEETGYSLLVDILSARLSHAALNGSSLFLVKTDRPLFDIYLEAFEDQERQHHNCPACRSFLNTYGSLAIVTGDGDLRSVFWGGPDPTVGHPYTQKVYSAPIEAMARAVRRGEISGPFAATEHVWGTRRTGDWQHLSAIAPSSVKLLRKDDVAPFVGEMFTAWRTVIRALGDFNVETLDRAVDALRLGNFDRAEKVMGHAVWLRDLSVAWAAARSTARKDALVWQAISTAPKGFCHPRSSVIGTLLEDLSSGMSLEKASESFNRKMRPDVYRRPTAPPKEQQIDRAEEAFKTLGLALSLKRRFARLEDCKLLWSPTPLVVGTARSERGAGLFSHLRGHDPVPSQHVLGDNGGRPLLLTWRTFQESYLPHLSGISAYQSIGPQNYGSYLTEANPGASPILQWDYEAERNPVSWFVKLGGSRATDWGLSAGTWVSVIGISPLPWMWGSRIIPNFEEGMLFILAGARYTLPSGSCLFPEILKSSLHAYRHVIEAHSTQTAPVGAETSSASGLLLEAGKHRMPELKLKGTTTSGVQRYFTIDRWA